jgi:hypothetical protein
MTWKRAMATLVFVVLVSGVAAAAPAPTSLPQIQLEGDTCFFVPFLEVYVCIGSGSPLCLVLPTC